MSSGSLACNHTNPISQAMHEFTDARDEDTLDEIWLVEHHPVFTQGQAGKAEHVLVPGDIPVIQSDRGGQVTYHGPGQQVMYVLLNLKRRKLGVRELVTLLEQTVVNTLAEYGIESHPPRRCPWGLRRRSQNLLTGTADPQRVLFPRSGAQYRDGSRAISRASIPAAMPAWR